MLYGQVMKNLNLYISKDADTESAAQVQQGIQALMASGRVSQALQIVVTTYWNEWDLCMCWIINYAVVEFSHLESLSIKTSFNINLNKDFLWLDLCHFMEVVCLFYANSINFASYWASLRTDFV